MLAFETRLAKASMTPVELRVPENQYHFVTLDEADKVTPNISWQKFFAAQHADVKTGFSLSQPKFFAEVDAMLKDVPADQWRAFLRFHTIDAASPYLSKPFADEHFEFYDQKLNGQKEQQRALEARARRDQREHGHGARRALRRRGVSAGIEGAREGTRRQPAASLKARIEKLDWMSGETKKKALEKWSTFLPKIGYPDKWRDWSGLKIVPDNYFANVDAATKFNYDYQIAQDRQADRSPRMGHDAADGQRVLQPDRQHDQLPGRDPAAAVLRREGRRRASTTAASAR